MQNNSLNQELHRLLSYLLESRKENRSSKINEIKNLLRKGANPYAKANSFSSNAIHTLAMTSTRFNDYSPELHAYWEEIAKLLLQQKGDLNIQDGSGFTALHHAVKACETSGIARQLIQAGCQVNIKNNRGITPLHEAIQFSKSDSLGNVFLLLDAGANLFSSSLPTEISGRPSYASRKKMIVDYCQWLIHLIIQKLDLNQLQFEGLDSDQNRCLQKLLAEQWRRLGSIGRRVLIGLLIKPKHPEGIGLFTSYLKNLSKNVVETVKTSLPSSTESETISLEALAMKIHQLPYELKEIIIKEIFKDNFLEQEILKEDLELLLVQQMPENDTRFHSEKLFSILVRHLSKHLNPDPEPVPEQVVQNNRFRPSY